MATSPAETLSTEAETEIILSPDTKAILKHMGEGGVDKLQAALDRVRQRRKGAGKLSVAEIIDAAVIRHTGKGRTPIEKIGPEKVAAALMVNTGNNRARSLETGRISLQACLEAAESSKS